MCTNILEQACQAEGGGSEILAWFASGACDNLHATFDLLPVGVAVVAGDAAGTARVVYANPALAEITGVVPGPGADLAVLALRLYLPDRRAPVPPAALPASRAITHGETTRDFEIHVLRPDGSWRVVQASSSPLSPAGGAIVILHDVTERKRAEEERDRLNREKEANRKLLEEIAAHSPSGIAVLSGPDHVHSLANGAHIAFAGYSGDLLGRTAAEVWTGAGGLDVRRLIRQAYESGEAVRVEEERMLTLRDGWEEEAFFRVNCVPLRDGGGDVTDVVLFACDLTELVVARRTAVLSAETLAAANDRLREQSCEIEAARDELGRANAELRTQAESLQAANEELRATTEELQCSNDELQVQREELQVQTEELRTAYEELRGSEERYRGLVEVSPEAILLSRGGRVVYANPAALALFGATEASQIVGLPPEALFSSEYHPVMRARIRRVLAGERVPFMETRIVRLDGTLRDVEVASCPFRNEGQPALQAIIRDITERVEAERALARSEQALRAIIDSADGFVWLKDADGRFLIANRYTARVHGCSPEEMVGRTVFDVLPEAVASEYTANDRKVLAAGATMRFEQRMDMPDGPHTFIAVKFPLWDAAGRAYAVGAVCTDITERKRIEDELRQGEMRHRVALDAADLGTWHYDLATGLMHLDERARRHLGIEADILPLEALAAWFHPDDFAALRETMRSSLDPTLGRGHWSADYRLTDLHGQARWVSVHACVFFEGDGAEQHPVSMIGTLADVTSRRRLEEELRQAQKMDALGRLAGGVAHDFNNMLVPIMTYSHLLVDTLTPDSKAHRRAVAMAAAAERAADLPRQLLAFSRKQVIEPKVMDLNGTVTGMEGMLRRLIGEDILLTFTPGAGLGRVLADPGQIDQVLLNLVVNARDAMPGGGRITIETRNVDLDDRRTRELVGVEPGPYVLLSVSDTGCGMDRETQARIFEPFFTTKEQGKGTGLGLSTVYGIVKQSGGQVRVYSEPGQGATLKVYLPRVDLDAADAGREPISDAAPRGSETILLVEDSDAVREVTRETLEDQGYHVITATHGDEALAAACGHSGPIHLLLTDVVMPEMSGRQLADQLSSERPGIPVIYMSGYTNDAVVRHGVLEEGLAFLQKPFTPAALLRKVREVLDRRAPTASP